MRNIERNRVSDSCSIGTKLKETQFIRKILFGDEKYTKKPGLEPEKPDRAID
ncbi:hypothetical protein QUA13_15030 [Microcoleus sp. S28C3]|uniref:hypothetical protein n=1 Tax=Microcoleus sp. S28C3 TaxID=3055414 RepID=UPI002FD3D69E